MGAPLAIAAALALGQHLGFEAVRRPGLMFLSSNFNVIKKEAFIERGNPAQDCYAYLKATISDAMSAGRFRPEFNDADELCQFFFASVHGLVALHIVKGDDPWVEWRPIRPTAQKMTEALIRGLTRDAEDDSAQDG